MGQKKGILNKTQIKNIHVEGYKSIKECDVEFGMLNILIGPNGAGKSNFLSAFKFIKQILSGEDLNRISALNGGNSALFYYGPKNTKKIYFNIFFDKHQYTAILEPTINDGMIFKSEKIWIPVNGVQILQHTHYERNYYKSSVLNTDRDLMQKIRSWGVYHFHDTGDFSPIKKQVQINDNMFLRSDGENLAAFLYLLKNKYEKHYYRIVQTIKLVAPFFGDFILRENPLSPNYISLEWHEKNNDVPFIANMLSDGTLRFICLATALLQPEELQPDTIFIDEPELGLHPYAIKLLGSLIRKTSKRKQVVISTQSVELLNEFDVEDIIVVDRANEQTTFKRLDNEELETWLEDYSLGEIWKKNIIGGRP